MDVVRNNSVNYKIMDVVRKSSVSYKIMDAVTEQLSKLEKYGCC